VENEELDHEYLPILGLETFRKAAVKLILGYNSKAIAEGRVGAAQCISGTGAVYAGAHFLSKHYPIKGAACYISKPTWGTFTHCSLLAHALSHFNLGLVVVVLE
jgi:aspartate aminotransferase